MSTPRNLFTVSTLMRKKAWWILLAAGLLLASIFVAASYRPRPVARIPLPDGTELHLQHVTYGTEHRMPGAGRLLAWISSLTERWPQLHLPLQAAEYTNYSQAPCALLWFTCYDPRTGQYTQAPAGGALRMRALGSESPGWPAFSGRATLRPPLPHSTYELRVFDRRQPTIPVEIGAQGKVTQIVVPNPLAGTQFPQWQPEPLPQTRRIARGEVTLSSLSFRKGGLDFDVQVLADGKSVPGLNHIGTLFTDATGNSSNNGYLPPGESAWKMAVSVARTADYAFAADEGLTLEPTPIPGPGQFHVLKVPAAEMKDGLRMVVLLGPGHYVWKDDVFTEATATPVGESASLASRVTGCTLTVDTAEPLLIFVLGSATETTVPLKWMTLKNKLAIRLRWPGHERGAVRAYTKGATVTETGFDAAFRPFKLQQQTPLPELTGTPITIQIVPVEPETVEFLVAPSKPAPPK